MLFNSFTFVFLFLPGVLAVWYVLRSRPPKLVFLTVVSCCFYGFWDFRFIPLLLASPAIDYFAGYLIDATENPSRRRLWLAGALFLNLTALFFFKYFDFVAGTVNELFALQGQSQQWPTMNLILPVGISFYTFNSISYTIDIFRRETKPAKSFLEFITFVVMFPHLVAGPIVRYANMRHQFEKVLSRVDTTMLNNAAWFFVIGLSKKVWIADYLGRIYVDPVFNGKILPTVLSTWFATAAYTLQIYFDFSGYSDMAVGLALALGFHFPMNFNSPYKSTSIAEFWRRWHISLSTWFRDYLFIPIGGSRLGQLKTLRNLLITMILVGLWHGAAWTFVVWGLYHGLLLVIHRSYQRYCGWVVPRGIAVTLTFFGVMFGWIWFRASDLPTAVNLITSMFGKHGLLVAQQVDEVMILCLPLFFAGLYAVFRLPNSWELKFSKHPVWAMILAILFFSCLINFSKPNPFIYFQF